MFDTMRRKKLVGVGITAIILTLSLIIGFSSLFINSSDIANEIDFPDFYTKTEDYFVVRIGDIPQIDELSYKLKLSGCIENPTNYSLSELRALPLIEYPLTIECIGNPSFGPLIATANWSGFHIYSLLDSLGLKSNATGVKYYAADGYYVTHTMGQLINNNVIGALYINDQVLPPIQGFPLRIINPGYYGAKQPAWVIEIEVIDMPLSDYWDDRGWDTSPRMHVDSKIFFPKNQTSMKSGKSILVGGAAYGGTRILMVEYTLNNGYDWFQAEIIKSIDYDHVWVFWLIKLKFIERGIKTIYVKATDIYNRTQPRIDSDRRDGDNSWPSLSIEII